MVVGVGLGGGLLEAREGERTCKVSFVSSLLLSSFRSLRRRKTHEKGLGRFEGDTLGSRAAGCCCCCSSRLRASRSRSTSWETGSADVEPEGEEWENILVEG